jgi:CRISPR-associated protein Cas2
MNNLPAKGSVRALQVTERRYARMKSLLGDPAKGERAVPQQIMLL